MSVFERPTREYISIESISSVKEFRYVSANIVFEKEFATWMVVHVVTHIQHQVIKHNKFLILQHHFLIKLTDCHSLVGLPKRLRLPIFIDLEIDFEDYQKAEEYNDVNDA